MRRAVAPLVGLLSVVFALPAGAQAGVDSGGGVRTSSTVIVRDGLGFPAAGVASAQTVQSVSGMIPGLPSATPVDLTFFSLRVTDEGVVLDWEGNSERRLFGFFLSRADDASGPPADADYTRVSDTFASWGPHHYTDTDVHAGLTYYYKLDAIWGDGGKESYGPWTIHIDSVPGGFLQQVLPAEPNPFREAFVIRFTLGEDTTVGWSLHDVRGRMITSGAYGRLPAGYHAYAVRPFQRLAAGVYFLTIQAGPSHQVQKLVSLP